MVDKLNLDYNIVKAYRISTIHKTDMKIIAWLCNSNDKDRFIAEAKKNKLTAEKNRNMYPTLEVYFNSHLTKSRRLLLGRLKALAKEKNYKYGWVSRTNILVRKDDDAKVFRIHDENDLNKLFLICR